MTEIGINGVSGRMGEAVAESARERKDTSVVFGIAPDGIERGFPVYEPANLEAAFDAHDPDVVIDFSVAEALPPLADACAETGTALVTGTTGFDDDQLRALETASEEIPVLRATNFSRGIQALRRALGEALEALPGYDVEVLETHHNRKQDAPSGTAKTILDDIADYRDFETVSGREGIHPREESDVGMLVRRAGNVRGEHEIMLADNDEVLSLTHRAEDRGVFAAGALDAADWLVGRPPGWYRFGSVIDAGN